ncbi:MAG: ATP-binding cassette domain-containing protein [Nevskia sp.]|nr:ATP-binding cassette domain-containing protein [Nevskia sp.]
MLALDLAFSRGNFSLQAQTRIGPGVTGICGPSGAGKSTLLSLIAGLLKPQRGSLHFGDDCLVDVARQHFLPPWQRHFGLVFQDGQLFPHLSVRDNLLYGWKQLAPEARRFTLTQVTALLEIDGLLARRPLQLSGGERQRGALGRALL